MYDENHNWTQVIQIWEEYQRQTQKNKIVDIKKQALRFFKKTLDSGIKRKHFRRLNAKIGKMQKSIYKLQKKLDKKLYYELQLVMKNDRN